MCFRMFNYGEFKAEDQELMLSALNKKVEDVYRSCIGDNEANIGYVRTKQSSSPTSQVPPVGPDTLTFTEHPVSSLVDSDVMK